MLSDKRAEVDEPRNNAVVIHQLVALDAERETR
jgi:hypothetical protein